MHDWFKSRSNFTYLLFYRLIISIYKGWKSDWSVTKDSIEKCNKRSLVSEFPIKAQKWSKNARRSFCVDYNCNILVGYKRHILVWYILHIHVYITPLFCGQSLSNTGRPISMTWHKTFGVFFFVAIICTRQEIRCFLYAVFFLMCALLLFVYSVFGMNEVETKLIIQWLCWPGLN